MSLTINNKNYTEYKKVFEILCKHLYPDTSPDTDPVALLNFWEERNPMLAKRGLKESIRDSISNLKEFPKEVISAINFDLEKNSLPNIYRLINVINNTLNKVLQHEKIKNINQFYIVNDILADTASDLTQNEKEKLSIYLGEFEKKVRR